MSTDQAPIDDANRPFLSIIIPAYNEEPRITETLRTVVEYFGTQSYTWEVAVVDDGSTDGTAPLVKSFADLHPSVRLIIVPHGGKGWAVNRGMLCTTGEYRFLCDADLSMPIEQVSRFLPPATSQFDIAIGSREVTGARRIGEPRRRHIMGRIYNLLVRVLAVPGFADTQCGFKCFRGQVAQKYFPFQTLYGFAFDVEILFLASKGRLRIQEVPIDWYYRPKSKVSPVRDSLAMSRDILKIRWHYLRGGYKELTRQANDGLI